MPMTLRQHHERLDVTAFKRSEVYADFFQEGTLENLDKFLTKHDIDPQHLSQRGAEGGVHRDGAFVALWLLVTYVSVCICMSVCMYVCMYVFMYVTMCMYEYEPSMSHES